MHSVESDEYNSSTNSPVDFYNQVSCICCCVANV